MNKLILLSVFISITSMAQCCTTKSWPITNQCYTCTDCQERFDISASTSTTCGAGFVGCMKVRSTSNIITKTCAVDCKEGRSSSGNEVFCCYDNLCNSSPKTQPSLFIKCFIVTFFVIYSFIFNL